MLFRSTLGIPRRHWDIGFAGNPMAHEFPGAAYLMMGLMAMSGLVAIAGGVIYLLITVGSVFFGKRIETPDFRHVRVSEGAARPAPALQPGVAAIAGHGSAGFSAPGTFTLAIVFLVSFVLYYFVNWKYLSTVWPLS